LSKLHEPDDRKTLKRKQKAKARLEEKKKVVSNSGHHGAPRAGHEMYPAKAEWSYPGTSFSASATE